MEAISEQRVASSDAGGRDLLAARYLLLALTVIVGATRFLAASHSIWDWDEALFCSALRDYNVAAHHPHPPGFPLFVAVAKVVRLFVHDDFHALRAVSVAASLFVFPATYAAARAFRFPFRTSVIGALLFSFLPNVWYWGGTALSDVFAIVLFLGAAALLLRDDESRWWYIAGGVLFAATLLVRPQNVVMSYPWLLASWRRLRARRIGIVFACGVLITVLVLGGYGVAARMTGWRDYIEATKSHQKYVASVDGSLNPNRPSVVRIFYDFAIDPFLAYRPSKVLFFFAVLAFVRPRRRDVDVVATFAPNFLLAWFMLSVTGVSRLSIGYLPMHALLAADGMGVAADFLTQRVSAVRRERVAAVVQALFAAVVIGRNIGWVWPALREVRIHDAPTAAAPKWMLDHVPRSGKVYVQGGLAPFADYYLEGYNLVPVDDDVDPTALPVERDAWYMADRLSDAPGAINFRRSRKKLWALSHRRYFETCEVPVGGWPRYREGWYGAESNGSRSWRWMPARAHVQLQPFSGEGELGLSFYAPLDAEPAPSISISLNGHTLERFVPTSASFDRKYRLAARSDAANELVIEVDRVINPARAHGEGDPRDLGLRLDALTWRPVR